MALLALAVPAVGEGERIQLSEGSLTIDAEIVGPTVESACEYWILQSEGEEFDEIAQRVFGRPVQRSGEVNFSEDAEENRRMYVYIQKYGAIYEESDGRLDLDSLGNILWETPESLAVFTVANSSCETVDGWSPYALEFATPEEAGEQAVAYVKSVFGLDTQVVSVGSLNATQYDQWYEKRRASVEQDLAEGSPQDSTEKWTWPTQDVCYAVRLEQMLDGIPIFRSEYRRMTESALAVNAFGANTIRCLVFPEGIRYVRHFGARMVRASETPMPIISAEEAAKAVAAQKKDWLDPVGVRQIQLVYLPLIDGYIHPCWSFLSAKSNMFVDAFTGEWVGEL